MALDLTRALADARIQDLHREAAHRRLTRQATPLTGTGTSVSADLVATWAAINTWLSARTHRDPACCPA